MPELPEVETLRRDLCQVMLGRTIIEAIVSNRRSVRAHLDPAEFVSGVCGLRVDAIFRRGKFLSFLLKDPYGAREVALVAHMGMSGQMRRFEEGDPLPKHAHVVLQTDDRLQIAFIDPRTFGQMYIDDVGYGGFAVSLSRLGADPIHDRPLLGERLGGFRKSAMGVKWLLLDQSRVCGIGNMYADEILFRSQIRFDRPGHDLSEDETTVLAGSISKVLDAAIEGRGSSLRDLQYRDINGRIGMFQQQHAAYGREGLPCMRCSGTIVRIFCKGRSSFVCSYCQK